MLKHLSKLINLSPRLARPQYAITIYDPCGSDFTGTAFVPEADCLDEGARIVGAFLAEVSLDLSSLADTAAIDAAITADTLKVVKGLSGAWPKATSNKKPGKGYNREKHSSSTYALTMSHYSVDANLKFWNAVNNRKDLSMLFVFEDLSIWGMLDKDSKLIPMDIVFHPSADGELGNTRMFEGDVTFTTKSLPYSLLAPVVAGFTVSELSDRFK